MDFLLPYYFWLKAMHVIFVIFWMAGMFILPRYLVHHQEALGTPEAAQWVERETKLRHVILTPSMIIVWVLGLTIATVGHFWTAPWLHAKLTLVLLLSGYHGWAVAYARRLARGEARLSGKQLRLINELPALFVVLIVILVVVKPF
ncbi:MAG: CopD family protein [Pseudomonadota bacterium]